MATIHDSRQEELCFETFFKFNLKQKFGFSSRQALDLIVFNFIHCFIANSFQLKATFLPTNKGLLTDVQKNCQPVCLVLNVVTERGCET